MKCTMHRWHLASGSIELTVDTSPAHRSPATSRTPFRPRSIMSRKNRSQLAGVIDLTGGHTRQIHLHQRLLDTGLAPPVAFDHRRLEQGALEFGHLQLEPADLGRQSALVVTGPERLPTGLALVSGGVRDLVGLKRRASR